MKRTWRQEIRWVLLFVGTLWLVHIVDAAISSIDFNPFGLIPRTTSGLRGIPLMPFLHGSWGHLIGNSVPLIVLLGLLAGSRADSRGIVVGLILIGGSLLWLVGRSNNHIGASGLVYGLVAFLIASGFWERRFTAIVVALIVGVLYGTTLFWGVLPSVDKTISWEGHLTGAAAGLLLAWLASTSLKKTVEQT
jgi:membrane associated rhomboid family serine protease